jgi:excisionase family DNA binding protein
VRELDVGLETPRRGIVTVTNPELVIVPEERLASTEFEEGLLPELERFLREHGGLVDQAGSGSQRAQLVSADGKRSIDLPPSVYKALLFVAHHMARGDAISLMPLHKELTTQQAADLLNVSRPFLIKLLDQGEMRFRRVGTHRRIKLSDLLRYRKRRDDEARNILAEIAAEAQEMGIYS